MTYKRGLGGLGILLACTLSAVADDAEELAFFTEYVEPLLVANCYDCHSHDAGEASGGLVLDSKAGWSVGGDSGPAIVPQQLDKSLLWRVINYREPGLEMPPDGKLAESELLLLKKWIESGAADPRVDGKAAERTAIDLEAGKQWWSFQPLRQAELPDADRTRATSRSRIDRWIDAALQDAGLKAAPPASDDTLLRRLAYDLTGLPPGDAMIGRDRPLEEAAYSAYVDRLLASPQFGEKWGRHWLDVARYADSNGSSFNVTYHNAWRYRNWVIDAINRNLPIDRFLQMQIAGDLLPADDCRQRDENYIATGFLLLGSKVLGAFDKEQLTLDVIDEQLDTIGKAMMGMTLGCARCHDHKFDPIPQTDYYALAGILASTVTLEDRIGSPKDDESDWSRRGLGPDGDRRLREFLQENRYAWVKVTQKRFQARKRFDELERQRLAAGRPSDQLLTDWKAARERLDELNSRHAELAAQMPAHAMAVRDADRVGDIALRIRGVASSKGDAIPRGFLRVASFNDQPQVPKDQSGRLELARWMTSPNNPLTARVFVNRVWKHLFGEGLVRSVDNFGTTGDRPSHPELLDELALRFIDSGWDLKALVRKIVLTDAYRRQTAEADPRDPENRLLAHQNLRRLDAEEVRDTLLLLSGQLECGPSESKLQTLPIGDVSNAGEYLEVGDHRRTVYQPVIRTLEPDVMQLFDASNNAMVTGRRPRTIVAPQSLYFLNSSFVQQAAGRIGQRLLRPYLSPDETSVASDRLDDVLPAIVEDCFVTIVCRKPTTQERTVLMRYLREQADDDSGLTEHDMLKICQTLLGSTQFQFLD
jgi:hypothetical protein